MRKKSNLKCKISNEKLTIRKRINFKLIIDNFAFCNAVLSKRGFTLIELMVVILILGILAAIVAPRIIGRADEAKVAEAKIQIRNLETALKLYKIDNGVYPSTEQSLDALIEKPAIGVIPKKWRESGYLEKRKIPADPWGNPYVYISPGVHGDYDIVSYGADGVRGGEGFDKDIENWNIE